MRRRNHRTPEERGPVPRFAAALGIVAGVVLGCAQPPAFRGTALDPPRAVEDFTLHDQFDKPVRLSDFRGRVAVLTFLYTSCPDVCPIIAGKLRSTVESLGEAGRGIAIVVVTVDPERDTVERMRAYSEQHRMLDRWHFVTGGMQALRPVWEYYWVGTVRKDRKGEVMHQAPVHLIDRQGKIRVVYGSGVEAADLAHDIRLLLKS
ncbi:MAG: SCO family protein [candidate division NC10 bacterium]|nr:SCO family protein [candidate division NC10 bacterium]